MIFLALPLWWALLFLGLAFWQQDHVRLGVVLVGIAVVADMLSIGVINQRLVKDQKLWPFLWLAPFGELLGLPILLQSLFSHKVRWRGRWLAIDSDSLDKSP
jgi:hypothetical protein